MRSLKLSKKKCSKLKIRSISPEDTLMNIKDN